ncbi:hypothetical protein VNI00_012441 [Paramarasmius palmivorus]|uniref:DUF6697 domain-containing protein n=1 Tax=Paramarasmius palmivorus TaxID=297713 RepID=A0AAW0C5A5_9AGAR
MHGPRITVQPPDRTNQFRLSVRKRTQLNLEIEAQNDQAAAIHDTALGVLALRAYYEYTEEELANFAASELLCNEIGPMPRFLKKKIEDYRAQNRAGKAGGELSPIDIEIKDVVCPGCLRLVYQRFILKQEDVKPPRMEAARSAVSVKLEDSDHYSFNAAPQSDVNSTAINVNKKVADYGQGICQLSDIHLKYESDVSAQKLEGSLKEECERKEASLLCNVDEDRSQLNFMDSASSIDPDAEDIHLTAVRVPLCTDSGSAASMLLQESDEEDIDPNMIHFLSQGLSFGESELISEPEAIESDVDTRADTGTRASDSTSSSASAIHTMSPEILESGTRSVLEDSHLKETGDSAAGRPLKPCLKRMRSPSPTGRSVRPKLDRVQTYVPVSFDKLKIIEKHNIDVYNLYRKERARMLDGQDTVNAERRSINWPTLVRPPHQRRHLFSKSQPSPLSIIQETFSASKMRWTNFFRSHPVTSKYTDVVFIDRRSNPDAPQIAGESGLYLFPQDDPLKPDIPRHPIFERRPVVLSRVGDDQWRLIGLAKFTSTASLTTEEWKSLRPACRDAWVHNINSKTWGRRIKARIRLRKNNNGREPSRSEVNTEVEDEEANAEGKPFPEITLKEIETTLKTGKTRLQVYGIVILEYPVQLQKHMLAAHRHNLYGEDYVEERVSWVAMNQHWLVRAGII